MSYKPQTTVGLSRLCSCYSIFCCGITDCMGVWSSLHVGKDHLASPRDASQCHERVAQLMKILALLRCIGNKWRLPVCFRTVLTPKTSSEDDTSLPSPHPLLYMLILNNPLTLLCESSPSEQLEVGKAEKRRTLE